MLPPAEDNYGVNFYKAYRPLLVLYAFFMFVAPCFAAELYWNKPLNVKHVLCAAVPLKVVFIASDSDLEGLDRLGIDLIDTAYQFKLTATGNGIWQGQYMFPGGVRHSDLIIRIFKPESGREIYRGASVAIDTQVPQIVATQLFWSGPDKRQLNWVADGLTGGEYFTVYKLEGKKQRKLATTQNNFIPVGLSGDSYSVCVTDMAGNRSCHQGLENTAISGCFPEKADGKVSGRTLCIDQLHKKGWLKNTDFQSTQYKKIDSHKVEFFLAYQSFGAEVKEVYSLRYHAEPSPGWQGRLNRRIITQYGDREDNIHVEYSFNDLNY